MSEQQRLAISDQRLGPKAVLTCRGCRWHWAVHLTGNAAHYCEHTGERRFIGVDATTPVWCPLLKGGDQQ